MTQQISNTPRLPFPPSSSTIGQLAQFDSDLVRALFTDGIEVRLRANASLPKDGSEAMTGDLDLGGFSLVNLGPLSGDFDLGGNGIVNWGANNDGATAVVGTAAQSGGVPAGAILERGSNADGEFVRLADGTQICWQEGFTVGTIDNATGNIFRSDTATWTYPAGFTGDPQAGFVNPAGIGLWGGMATPGNTQASMRLFAATSVGSSQDAHVMVIGRWF